MRYFPKDLYNNTDKLINYFERNSITRSTQLNNCILKIIGPDLYIENNRP